MKALGRAIVRKPFYLLPLAFFLIIGFLIRTPVQASSANETINSTPFFLFLGTDGRAVVNELADTDIDSSNNLKPAPAGPPGAYQPSQEPGKTIADVLRAGFTDGIRFVRTVILFFLLMYSVFMAVGMAFGQAGMEDILSWVLGVIFFAGAGAVGQIYGVLFL